VAGLAVGLRGTDRLRYRLGDRGGERRGVCGGGSGRSWARRASGPLSKRGRRAGQASCSSPLAVYIVVESGRRLLTGDRPGESVVGIVSRRSH